MAQLFNLFNIIDYDNIKCIKNTANDLDHKSYFIYYNNSDYVFLTYIDSGDCIETLKIHNFNEDHLYNHGYGYATIYHYYTYTDVIKRKEEECVEYFYYKNDRNITDIYVKIENRKRILEKI